MGTKPWTVRASHPLCCHPLSSQQWDDWVKPEQARGGSFHGCCVPNHGLSLPLILFVVTLIFLPHWEDWVKPEQARCESIPWCFVSQIWIVLASHPLCCRPPSFPTVGGLGQARASKRWVHYFVLRLKPLTVLASHLLCQHPPSFPTVG